MTWPRPTGAPRRWAPQRPGRPAPREGCGGCGARGGRARQAATAPRGGCAGVWVRSGGTGAKRWTGRAVRRSAGAHAGAWNRV
ncbi:MAG: hypothetical protein C0475_05465 [Planctomyces sp.]|nr:hypothetical protein [Planctomyces sp.]